MFESHLKQPISFPTLTGSIVTFNSQYAGLPLKSHTVAVTATQSGSGTPSPDNVRPISGYSAINISHSDADTSNPTVYTIQIGSTVYGGEYDARTGVLTVTHGFVDLGSANWQYNSSYSVFYTTDIKGINYGAPFICEIYKDAGPVSISLLENYSGELRADALYIKNTDYGLDVNAFKTAMNGIILVRELANPITLSITPTQISAIVGVNNIFADTGETTLQYIKLG